MRSEAVLPAWPFLREIFCFYHPDPWYPQIPSAVTGAFKFCPTGQWKTALNPCLGWDLQNPEKGLCDECCWWLISSSLSGRTVLQDMPILTNSKTPSLMSVCLKPQITGLKKRAQRKNVQEAHSVARSGTLMSHFSSRAVPWPDEEVPGWYVSDCASRAWLEELVRFRHGDPF